MEVPCLAGGPDRILLYSRPIRSRYRNLRSFVVYHRWSQVSSRENTDQPPRSGEESGQSSEVTESLHFAFLGDERVKYVSGGQGLRQGGTSTLVAAEARLEAEEFLLQFVVIYPNEEILRLALRGDGDPADPFGLNLGPQDAEKADEGLP